MLPGKGWPQWLGLVATLKGFGWLRVWPGEHGSRSVSICNDSAYISGSLRNILDNKTWFLRTTFAKFNAVLARSQRVCTTLHEPLGLLEKSYFPYSVSPVQMQKMAENSRMGLQPLALRCSMSHCLSSCMSSMWAFSVGAGVASISQHEDVARPLSHVSVNQMERSVIGTSWKREENHCGFRSCVFICIHLYTFVLYDIVYMFVAYCAWLCIV